MYAIYDETPVSLLNIHQHIIRKHFDNVTKNLLSNGMTSIILLLICDYILMNRKYIDIDCLFIKLCENIIFTFYAIDLYIYIHIFLSLKIVM